MIKATAKGANGRNILVLGLSFANLDKLRAAPGDDHIRIDGRALGLPIDVMIFAGETEAHCAETLADGIGPNTKVNISPRSKQ
jgi:hypothetical protein